MNKKKRVLTGLLFLSFLWTLAGGTLLADDSGNCTITISNSAGGYIYEAYQVFAGRLHTDPDTSEEILSDIIWGSGISEEGIAALQKQYGVLDAAGLAGILSEDGRKAQEFAQRSGQYLAQPSGTSGTCTDGEYVITVPESGYYLIKNSVVPEIGGAYTSYILQVAGDVRVSPKSDLPSCDKKVEEDDDSKKESSFSGTTADHDIGDAVNFTLTAALPENYGDYKAYSLYFHDTLPDGLTFDAKSVRAYVFTPGSGTFPVKENCYWIASDMLGRDADGCTFEVQFGNLNALTSAEDKSTIPVHSDSVITVTYSAVLNERALIGNPGNPNTLFIGYSDNPCDKSSMNRTPSRKVAVFTYELVLQKVDEHRKPLKGAAFELYKYHAARDRWEKTGNPPEISEDETKFTFTGLDAGRYKLTESRTPDGYNRMDALYFAVEAVQNEDTSSVSGYSTIVNTFVTDEEGNPLPKAGEVFQIGQGGSLVADIVNQKGSILPGTGGAGAVFFYAAGILLLAAAAFWLYRKRRGNQFEKPEKKD